MIWTDEQLLERLAECPNAWAIAESMVDEEVAAGEYEGCSTELEMAFTEYENRVERLLQAVGG